MFETGQCVCSYVGAWKCFLINLLFIDLVRGRKPCVMTPDKAFDDTASGHPLISSKCIIMEIDL